MKKNVIRALCLTLCLTLLSGLTCAFALSGARRGQTVTFGTYEQDGNYYNGAEPIQWQVLDVNGSYALLLSRFVLEWTYFNNVNSQAIWNTSSVCEWLNNDFMYEAFSDEEIAALGNYVGPVAEKVFLLSESEVRQYLPTVNARLAYPTSYCLNQGAYTWASTGGCHWWLRDTIKNWDYTLVKGITGSGDYDLKGQTQHQNRRGVRPAIWVKLEG